MVGLAAIREHYTSERAGTLPLTCTGDVLAVRHVGVAPVGEGGCSNTVNATPPDGKAGRRPPLAHFAFLCHSDFRRRVRKAAAGAVSARSRAVHGSGVQFVPMQMSAPSPLSVTSAGKVHVMVSDSG